jgi:chorismate-pyruvate lyase
MNLDDLGLLQKILLSTDGTVTDLVALYAGEEIHVHKVHQEIAVRQPPAVLACEGPVQMLYRQILLRGRQRTFLYADSQFVFARFSAGVQQQLLHTDQPIGLLWKQARLETYREIIEKAVIRCPHVAQYFELPEDAWFVSRTYLIHHGGRPLGAITEQWPTSWFADRGSAHLESPTS